MSLVVHLSWAHNTQCIRCHWFKVGLHCFRSSCYYMYPNPNYPHAVVINTYNELNDTIIMLNNNLTNNEDVRRRIMEAHAIYSLIVTMMILI